MNISEKLIKEKLEDRGFEVLRNGWPDFLCIRKTQRYAGKDMHDNEVYEEISGSFAVEVKYRSGLSAEQKAVHKVLKAARIPVYIIRPDDVIDRINPRRRVFLTNAEISHLKDMAGHAGKRATDLHAELEKLKTRILEIQRMIEAAGAHLVEAEFLIEPASVDLQIGGYALPTGRSNGQG